MKTMLTSTVDAIYTVADLMTAAALTAPKTSGQDKIVTLILDGDEKKELSQCMMEFYEKELHEDFVKRDAITLHSCPCVVLIGVRKEPYGMPGCSLCGFKSCKESADANAKCVFNISDLGIAAGSAAAVAADHRIDNRIMYSVGMGAIRMGCFPNDVVYAYGIPLSATNKSVFFDRDNEAILNSYSEKIKEDGFTFARLLLFFSAEYHL